MNFRTLSIRRVYAPVTAVCKIIFQMEITFYHCFIGEKPAIAHVSFPPIPRKAALWLGGYGSPLCCGSTFCCRSLTAYQQKRAELSTARWLYSFFRVKIIPMIAPIKIIGATLTNSHSNECNATPRTAVSGLL